MNTPPSVVPFAALLADLATDLRRGANCLLICDKGWALPLFSDLRKRLEAKNILCEYLDGRPAPGSDSPADVGVMLTAITQIRKAVRGNVEGVVLALPHLDVMTTTDGGWTNISREVIPLLYENPAAQWLGFRDPSLPLPQVVEKVFGKCYSLDAPYRVVENVVVTPQTIPIPNPRPVSEPLPPKPAVSANAPEAPPEASPPEPPATTSSPDAPG